MEVRSDGQHSMAYLVPSSFPDLWIAQMGVRSDGQHSMGPPGTVFISS